MAMTGSRRRFIRNGLSNQVKKKCDDNEEKGCRSATSREEIPVRAGQEGGKTSLTACFNKKTALQLFFY